MTLFLASVRDAAEAELALDAGADIIDLKDSSRGALGALDRAAIVDCIKKIAGRKTVSATVGDLPLKAETIRRAVVKTGALGVDYVKLGIFPGEGAERWFLRLKAEAARIALILVVFADAMPQFDPIRLATRIGAHGIMIDTLGKDGGSLPDYISYIDLAGHVASAKHEGLLVGLAGSLHARHVPSLLALEPDLLGFRGALCRDQQRGAPLDPSRLTTIRSLIPPVPRILPESKLPNLTPHALC